MITDKERLLVYMSMLEISNKKQEILIDSLVDFSIENLMRNPLATDIFSKEEYHKFLKEYDAQVLNSSIDNMIKSGIRILTVFSQDYPESLFDLPERPLILYVKGDLSLLKRKCLAVVGTRMPTNYGNIITNKFVEKLAQSGFVIVSGLCYGVDTIAHRKTLEVGGKTIAVVGSGFGNIYPASNTNLADEIAEKGLLISEYPPSFKPKRYTFPRRNRIVAGISSGVLITEAGIKSGTIHTKEFALEYGKDIFAVPGNINSNKSELTNHLIKTTQAHCILSPNDIIEFYGMEASVKKQKMISLNFDEQTIVNLLKDGEKDFDYLAENSKIPVNILSSCLTTLEIRGLIRRLPAKFFALT